MAIDITDRLMAVMASGNLTVADLARWLERPDPTVRGWVTRKVSMGGAPVDIRNTLVLLMKLERLIEKRRKFPVPHMSQSLRIAYLREIKASL